MSGQVRVQPNPDGDGWVVDASDASGSSSVPYDTQDLAETAGRILAKHFRAELVVHGRDGRIRERDSYGNDPRSRPG